jgi:hypothetical protein
MMESRWKWHPETIRGKLYKVGRKLEERYDNKIIFGDFEEGQVYLSSIDCVHFAWQECLTDPGGKWYSH